MLTLQIVLTPFWKKPVLFKVTLVYCFVLFIWSIIIIIFCIYNYLFIYLFVININISISTCILVLVLLV